MVAGKWSWPIGSYSRWWSIKPTTNRITNRIPSSGYEYTEAKMRRIKAAKIMNGATWSTTIERIPVEIHVDTREICSYFRWPVKLISTGSFFKVFSSSQLVANYRDRQKAFFVAREQWKPISVQCFPVEVELDELMNEQECLSMNFWTRHQYLIKGKCWITKVHERKWSDPFSCICLISYERNLRRHMTDRERTTRVDCGDLS